MSTKIYNAYKINIPLYELKKKIDSIRKGVNELYIENVNKEFQSEIDVYLRDGKSYSITDRFMRDGIYRTKQNGKPQYHFNRDKLTSLIMEELDICEPTFVFYVHESGNYCQIFGIHGNPTFKEFVDDLCNNGTLSDFHYQNQTDPYVEGMTDEEAYDEYERRRIIWDEILSCDVSCAPVNCGFTYSMIDTFTYYQLNYDISSKLEQLSEEIKTETV